MPWSIKKRDNEYCVVKEDDGEVEGCHSTRAKANAQLRALHASEGKEMDKDKEDKTKSSYYNEVEDRYEYIPYTVTSFSELEEMEAAMVKTGAISTLIGKFKAIIDNIFFNDEVDDKTSALKKATSEFNSRLKIMEKKDKSRDNGLLVSEPRNSSFNIFKSDNGEWRWAAIWSNKYRDNDNPPEILSEASHLDFIKSVEIDKSWNYPELWLWHYGATVWGDTTYLAYDKENGFTIACGNVRKGCESVAESIASLPPDTLGVSHGMPITEIKRDADDSSIIVRYRSKEISVLPIDAAANKLTGFTLLGGTTMELYPQDKAVKIKEWLGDERFESLGLDLDSKGKEAEEKGLEFKDKDADTDVETNEDNQEEKETETPAERQEVEDVVVTLAKSIAEMQTVILAMADVLKSATDEIKSLKQTDEEKIASKAEGTPRASLSAIVGSIIGNDAARVDGRTKEAQGPKVTSPSPSTIVTTGSPFDTILTDIVNGEGE